MSLGIFLSFKIVWFSFNLVEPKARKVGDIHPLICFTNFAQCPIRVAINLWHSRIELRFVSLAEVQ